MAAKKGFNPPFAKKSKKAQKAAVTKHRKLLAAEKEAAAHKALAMRGFGLGTAITHAQAAKVARIKKKDAKKIAKLKAELEACKKKGPKKGPKKHKGKKGPGRPKKSHAHKGPGRPKKAHKGAHKGHKGAKKGHKGHKGKRAIPRSYSIKKAIARTRASLEYNAAKLNFLTTGKGKDTYAKAGKALHRFRSPKKICHYKTR